jgi:hypothetical protein
MVSRHYDVYDAVRVWKDFERLSCSLPFDCALRDLCHNLLHKTDPLTVAIRWHSFSASNNIQILGTEYTIQE